MQTKTSLITASLFFCGMMITYAQKLPSIQQISLRAPTNIQIDGKPSEWDDKFQAYNHATDIFYTMANDDDNLYLVVQAKSDDAIAKITQGGITLSIRKPEDKNEMTSQSITYPVVQEVPYFNIRKKKNVVEYPTANSADSLMRHNNALIEKNFKWIKVSDIKDVDTLISVYNNDGIKSKGLFDNKKIYTCEFSIKLKLIRGSVIEKTKYLYDVRLNGKKPAAFAVGKATPGNEAFMAQLVEGANKSSIEQSAPTDFKGYYILK